MVFILDHISRIIGIALFLDKGWETGNTLKSSSTIDLEVDSFTLDATPFSKVAVFLLISVFEDALNFY